MSFAARRLFARAASSLRVTPIRLFTTSVTRFAAGPPIIQGEGAKIGEIPTDEVQATGLERLELLGNIEGVDVFDMKPLEMTRLGTVKNPIKIKSYWPTRIVGCTGFPADSHDTIFLHLNRDLKNHRCPECGSVYTLDFIGDDNAEDHH